MSNDLLIQAKDVSKRYCRNLNRSLWYGVRDIGSEFLGRNGERKSLRPREFWAVDNASFEVRRGECLGLIGPNGSGKSTLLKMLCGVIKPDSGRIVMRGNVAALIQLGAGFNPVLTGRENVYNNAAVLGMGAREVDRHLDAILEFAEIDDAIDAPVGSYSSGMRVRLGFAVAAHLSPDVLLLDEVLAVGDAGFRDKCYRRIIELRKSAAVVFVSHIMEQIGRICDKTLVLSRGKVDFSGDTGEGIAHYEALNSQRGDQEADFLSLGPPITAFTATLPNEPIASGSPLPIRFRIESEEPMDDFTLRVVFYNAAGAFAADCNLMARDHGISLARGTSAWEIGFASIPLRNGRYRLGLNIIDPQGDLVVWSYKEHDVEVYGSHPSALADCQLQARSWTNLTASHEVAP